MKGNAPMAERQRTEGSANWVLVLVVATAIVALYGPLVWELAHG